MIALARLLRRQHYLWLCLTIVVAAGFPVAIRRAVLADSPCDGGWLTPPCVAADVRILQDALGNDFAYRDLSAPDLFQALRDLERDGSARGMPRSRFVHRLRLIVGRLFDGHARLEDNAAADERFVPMLVEVTPGGLVAIQPDRSDFLNPHYPYLDSIDGLPVGRWLEVAGRFVPAGSPGHRERRVIGLLRDIELLREELGRPPSPRVEIRLRAADGSLTSPVLLWLVRQRPLYNEWPERASGFLSPDIVYLRLSRMDSAGTEAVREWMPQTTGRRALIIDVRGNRGGSRAPVLDLYSRLVGPAEAPRVLNVAAVRLERGRRPPSLSDRFLFPADDQRWTAGEREAIGRWRRGVTVTMPNDSAGFGPWHFMVAGPARGGRSFEGRVVVLADASSFSATDVFLAAVKGRPNLVIFGQRSGGGSGRPAPVTLPNARVTIWLSSMLSLRPDGTLYDGNGIEPDHRFDALPTDFLRGRSDTVLDSAVEYLRRVRAFPERREDVPVDCTKSPGTSCAAGAR